MMADERYGSPLCNTNVMSTMGTGLAERYIARVDLWGKSSCGCRLWMSERNGGQGRDMLNICSSIW